MADSAANNVLVCNTSDEQSSFEFSSRWYLVPLSSVPDGIYVLRNFLKLPMKQFQCLSDYGPFSSLQGSLSSASNDEHVPFSNLKSQLDNYALELWQHEWIKGND